MSLRTQAFRHRLRFSLGTMLIVVTLLCLVFGLWTSRAVRQRNAVAALQAFGPNVSVLYAYEVDANYESKDGDPPGPEWLRELLGIDYLATVVSVTIDPIPDDERTVLDDQLAVLKELADLRALELAECYEVTDAGIARLRDLTALRKLDMHVLQLTGAGLAALEPLTHLQELSLRECRNLTDDGMAHLGRITSLRKLEIDGSELLTNTGMAELRSLPNLESLSLDLSGATTDAVLESLQSLPRLRHLELSYGNRAGEAGLKHLAGFQSLESLVLDGNNLTDADFSQLPQLPQLKSLALNNGREFTGAALVNLEKLPNLQELQLGGEGELTPQGMAHLQKLPRLKKLSIWGGASEPSDECLEVIGQLSNLRSLTLTACNDFTDKGMASLAGLSDLEELDIAVELLNQISPAALASLRAALPKCRVDYRQLPHGWW